MKILTLLSFILFATLIYLGYTNNVDKFGILTLGTLILCAYTALITIRRTSHDN